MTHHKLLTGEDAPLAISEYEEWIAHDELTIEERPEP